MHKFKRIVGWTIVWGAFVGWVVSLWLNAFRQFGWHALWIVPVTVVLMFVAITFINWLIHS